ncbi:MAG: GNAT family N-acetyltransferase [Chitinophagaceae bacterium]|nr:GNAT family N-acetyltransferase [Chitinophagaceae bacterium]
MKLVRTTSADPDFAQLVSELDAFLAYIDGDEHAFYAQLNKTATLQHVVVAYDGDAPAACGAIRELEPGTMEVKRMYTKPASRGKGVAKQVLTELEKWTAELGYHTCVLETGNRQPEAIALYTKSGYSRIPNYGKYADVGNSVCFEKKLG